MKTSDYFRILAPSNYPSDAEYAEAEACLLHAGYCPACARRGERARLGRHTPGNAYEYAGRACLECEEFWPDAEQAEYAMAGDDCHSDADPGL